jgi:hypothetical protein
VTLGAGRASLTLPVPPSGTARATIDVPGEQADVQLSAGLITGRSAQNGRTIVEATLAPGSSTEVSWSMRDSAPVAAARELRALADVFTLVTLGDSDVRMAALVDVTVVTGTMRTLDVRVPSGSEMTSLAGSTIETSEAKDGVVTLTLTDPSARRHQFLVGLERTHDVGSFSLATGLVTLPGVQRERGEVAIEGVGTLELTVAEREGLRRIDVRELNASLHALARLPLLSAFRYQNRAGSPPSLSFDVRRFGDAGVLAAVADRAAVTTIVTAEGRALTEVSLQIRNRAQPFLKVTLPPDATMVSVEVAGEPAKPALGADGSRVPLLRAGFRPQGPYNVSFVYLQSGPPFVRRGSAQMTLPRMDMPIAVVEWDVFVPARYDVRGAGGNVVTRDAFRPASARRVTGSGQEMSFSLTGSLGESEYAGGTATMAGWVTDGRGAPLPGVRVEVASPALDVKVRSGVTNESGAYRIVGLPAGTYAVTFRLEGFSTLTRGQLQVSTGATLSFDARLYAGSSESVTVVGEPPVVDVQNARQQTVVGGSYRPPPRKPPPPPPQPPQNVIDLQRRAAGVLPVRVEVPRAGRAYQFVKPLVVDQELVLTMRYTRQ